MCYDWFKLVCLVGDCIVSGVYFCFSWLIVLIYLWYKMFDRVYFLFFVIVMSFLVFVVSESLLEGKCFLYFNELCVVVVM